ncbi:Segregation and condensation protein A [[Clostridium] ultunense Esp]|uniref:segregation/condensation protein A n=1 Tax=Thermicanus aegyptius TaxID=94009 RepID=UPI0002B6F8FE|nr:segregation/condensation protein A [Thermicanus aegyptius]CCQ95600.1 Segregation and condensation protein A [[Clostridium] ultunense Esp]
MPYTVKLEHFEGPLDLLLHLIQKAEVDIYDIPIAEITEQYLAYLYRMREFQLDIASEFLVMAATLLEIKSKMLLPKPREEGQVSLYEDWEDELDPRDELVRRLIEYRKYKQVADQLRERSLSRNLLYTRPAADLVLYRQKEENSRLDLSMLQLYIAYQTVWRQKQEKEKVATIEREEVSIEKRSVEILVHLSQSGGILFFSRLFSVHCAKSDVVVTFLAILELIKQRKIECIQEKRFGEIKITIPSGGGGS